ncbi:hypothetical protein NMY22_g14621 [Coprinellus aureogranulatus]|nr:hypothetical protein NMY22_g14621 [Coprinellus aureogranulatus]
MRLLLPTHLLLLLQTALLLPQGSLSASIHKRTDPESAGGSLGSIKTTPVTVYKPRSLEFLQKTRLRSLQHAECLAPVNETERMEWDVVEVMGPNVEDRHTLAQLARMAGNAYALRGLPNWYEIDDAWNKSFPFGWEEGEGFRGHVFLASDNNTVVLSIKGTTIQGPTSRLDKYNDNLLFSCCCARNAWVMRTVCDCFERGWKCDDRCLSDALIQDSLFYSVGTKLIDDLIHIYPNANIWLVGHSLGGALASLLGATYGLPAVAFESPGERMAAQRLHLPMPPVNGSDTPSEDLSPLIQSVLTRFPVPSYIASFFSSFGNPASPPAPPPPSPPHAASHHARLPTPARPPSPFRHMQRMKWLVDVRKHVIKQVVHLLDMPKEGEEGVDWGEDGDDDDDDGGDEDPDPCKPGGDWCFDGKEVSSVSTFKSRLAKTADSILPGWGPGRGGKDKKGKKGDGEEPKKISSRVPKPIIESDCVDCFHWEFGSYKDKDEETAFIPTP